MIIQELEAPDVKMPTLGHRLWLGGGRTVAGALGALLGLALVGALTYASAHGVVPVSAVCGAPTTLLPHPKDPAFLGAPLGPLLLRNFAPGETRAVIAEYVAGYPTKVVTVATQSFDRPLTLTGRRCSDGHPLRFASAYPFTSASTPAPAAAFDQAGETIGHIEPLTDLPAVGLFGPLAPPYFLFSSTGLWLIELHDGDAIVGRVALEVDSAP